MIRCLLVLLFTFGLTSNHSSSATVYFNYDYGFAVGVPDGLTVERDEPPAPNHGFTVTLGDGREASVSAFYDFTKTGSATAALQETLSFHNWNGMAPVRHLRLAGLPAACASISLGNQRAVRLAAFRTHGRRTAIAYYFYLDTDAAHANHDRAVFRSILRGFTLQPLPD